MIRRNVFDKHIMENEYSSTRVLATQLVLNFNYEWYFRVFSKNSLTLFKDKNLTVKVLKQRKNYLFGIMQSIYRIAIKRQFKKQILFMNFAKLYYKQRQNKKCIYEEIIFKYAV